jgi:hypothetical protein
MTGSGSYSAQVAQHFNNNTAYPGYRSNGNGRAAFALPRLSNPELVTVPYKSATNCD